MNECGTLYEQACERFSRLGGVAVEIDYAPFAEAGRLMFAGPWVAERRVAISSLIEIETDNLLDVTKAVLRPGADYSAMDAFRALHRLARLRRTSETILDGIDALVVPTAPRPILLEDMQRDPIALNTCLGHYSYFANLLDLCAVAIPNGILPNGVPMGVTLLAPAWSDRTLLALARRLEIKPADRPFALTSRARPAFADATSA
jgi:amidase/allophanate hydrolase